MTLYYAGFSKYYGVVLIEFDKGMDLLTQGLGHVVRSASRTFSRQDRNAIANAGQYAPLPDDHIGMASRTKRTFGLQNGHTLDEYARAATPYGPDPMRTTVSPSLEDGRAKGISLGGHPLFGSERPFAAAASGYGKITKTYRRVRS